MRKAVAVVLADVERGELERVVKGRLSTVRAVELARIALFAAEGRDNHAIAAELYVVRRAAGSLAQPLRRGAPGGGGGSAGYAVTFVAFDQSLSLACHPG